MMQHLSLRPFWWLKMCVFRNFPYWIDIMHRSRSNIRSNIDSVIAKRISKDSRRMSLALFITSNRTISGPTLIESIGIFSRFQRQFCVLVVRRSPSTFRVLARFRDDFLSRSPRNSVPTLMPISKYLYPVVVNAYRLPSIRIARRADKTLWRKTKIF